MLSRAIRRAGGERDPYFGQVELLLPFDDDFSDRSSNRFVPTIIGSPFLGTESGVGSFWGRVGVFDGTQRLEFAHDPVFNIGTGDFTIELCFTAAGSAATYHLASQGSGTSVGWGIRLNSNGSMDFLHGSNAFAVAPSGTVDFSMPGSRHYLKVYRAAGLLNRVRGRQPSSGPFNPPDGWTVEGALLSPVSGATNLTNTNPLRIAASRTAGGMFNGVIEEFRLTVGYARQTPNDRQRRPWPQK
jgi:hypothetical protein